MFITILVLQEQTTIKISLQYKASIISEEKDKTSSLYVPSDTNQLVQQKRATNTQLIMILLHRATPKDSISTRFAILQIFYEFLSNFKVLSKK